MAHGFAHEVQYICHEGAGRLAADALHELARSLRPIMESHENRNKLSRALFNDEALINSTRDVATITYDALKQLQELSQLC